MSDFLTSTMSDLMDAHLKEVVRKHALEVKELDEAQLVEIIKQQILSGDIMKHVQIGVGEAGTARKQTMTYVPYSGLQRLRTENAKLKEMVRQARIALIEE